MDRVIQGVKHQSAITRTFALHELLAIRRGILWHSPAVPDNASNMRLYETVRSIWWLHPGARASSIKFATNRE